MENKFIRLDGKYFKVVLDEKGMLLEPAKVQEIVDAQFEYIALLDKPEANIEDNFLQDIIDSAQEELEKSLKGHIKKTALKMLGLEEEYHGKGFKVDHCNNRMGEVAQHLSVTVKDLLRQIPASALTLTDKEKEHVCQAFRLELLENYKTCIRRNVYSVAESMAREDAQHIAQKLTKERMEAIGEATLDKLFSPMSRKKKLNVSN